MPISTNNNGFLWSTGSIINEPTGSFGEHGHFLYDATKDALKVFPGLFVSGTTTLGVVSGTSAQFSSITGTFAGSINSALQVSNNITFNNSGNGDASGTSFNGSAPRIISYNTLGAPKSDGTGATGTWPISITGNATGLSSTLAVAGGGTGQTSFTDGQLLIGNTAGGLTKTTLTQGPGITITNGNGSIAISSSNNGTITGVTAGNGLTGGGTSGTVTLDIGAGNGISVAAESVAFDGNTLTAGIVNTDGASFVVVDGSGNSKKLAKGTINLSGFNNDSGFITSWTTVNNATLTLAAGGTGLSVSATPTFTANASTSKTITFTLASDTAATANTIALRDASGNLTATGFSGNGSSLSSLNAGNVSAGTLAVARGGTGASSFTNATVVIVGPTGTFQSAGTGTSGQLLKSQGVGSIPTWQDVAVSPNYTANTVAVRDASGNLAANRITVGVDDAAASTYRPIFATTNTTSAGTYSVNIDSGLTYRPDTNLFTATNIACTTSITNAGMVAGSGATVLRNATSFRLEFVSSDERLKKEIRTIPNALASVNAMRGVLFKWDNSRIPQEDISPDLVNANKDCVGFIAQEVQAVLPQLVHQVGLKDYLGVQYAEMTALLVEAIKELSAKNNALEARLAALEASSK